VAAPSRSADPALDALRAMEDAIAAARGGPDGLKGKEANDLEGHVADVRQALDAGDRQAALDAARKLDHRVVDLSKGLADDKAAALRQASAAVVRALGG
jgi:type VI protein secretion system component VasF